MSARAVSSTATPGPEAGREEQTVSLTIDGMEVQAEPGTTVLQAALNADIYVPTLCYHPELEPYGGCRLCIVEVEGLRGWPISCTTQVEDGMVVRTHSDEIDTIRRETVRLILADHDINCLTCPVDGHCRLQDVAGYVGIETKPAPLREERRPLDTSNPFFTFNPNKCILCGICVRTCADIVGANAIDFAWRGMRAQIVPSTGTRWIESSCESCGECVVRCPTGALLPQGQRRASRTVTSVCPYCGAGCRIELRLRGDRIVGVSGEGQGRGWNGWTVPPNDGQLCVKGRYGMQFVHSSHRLTRPLIRVNGQLRESTWDEALDLVATKLRELKEGYGPESLAVMSSSRATNELNYLSQKFARAVLGTNNIDNCARICHSPSVHGLTRAFGSGAMTNSIREIDGAQCIFLIGSNPTEAHPVIGSRIRRTVERGAKLIVSDPRDTDLARMADIHLQVKPGTDVALANAIGHHIVEKGLENGAFIGERTENFEAFRSILEGYSPEQAERTTGVPAELIKEAAELYAQSEPAMILYCLGITEHRNGVETVMSVANLALLTGHVGKPSSGVSPIRGQNNVQGACDMAAMPEVLPGYQSWEDPDAVGKFETAWNVKLPASGQGLFCTGLWDKVESGGIHGLYIIGEDPAMSEPHSSHVRDSLESLDFLVVQELFMTPTAERADVVLPAASFAETDGTYTNTERRVQRLHKALEPPGEAKEDWEIVCEIASRMGYPMDYDHPAQIFDELRKLIPSYAGITYERLEASPGLQWPCPREDHPGTMFLHQDKFARGRGRFHAIEQQGPAEPADGEFPYLLTTGRVRAQYNVGTMSRRTDGLNTLIPENFVELNPRDAERLGLAEGARVRISSRRGSLEARVHLRDIKEGVVWMPFHFAESASNLLTNDALDPICGTPEYKACAVRLEPQDDQN